MFAWAAVVGAEQLFFVSERPEGGCSGDSGRILGPPGQVDQKLRELRTLKQHYYPEGGWGWVVVIVGCLVHFLVNGSQVEPQGGGTHNPFSFRWFLE